MNYQTLTVGDIRQPGDEVKHRDGKDSSHGPADWSPVLLLGHPILWADNVAAEFRRPLP